MNSFKDRLSSLEAECRSRTRSKKMYEKEVAESQKTITNCKADIKTCTDGALVMEYLIHKKYDSVVELFEKTVTTALQTFFDDSYEFFLEISRRGDEISVEFSILNSEYKNAKPVKMTQGRALGEIVGLIIRIILVKLDKQLPDFIILDEPLGGLSPVSEQKAGEFLNKLTKDFGIQLIIITQSRRFASECEETIYIEKEKR